jgi:hypothetical protein
MDEQINNLVNGRYLLGLEICPKMIILMCSAGAGPQSNHFLERK